MHTSADTRDTTSSFVPVSPANKEQTPFIVLEGDNGSGKTTMIKEFTKALRALGYTVAQTREPSDGPIGKLIRQELAFPGTIPDDRAMGFLFAADRMDHLRRIILPARTTEVIVVSDRYKPSTAVFQRKTGLVEQINAYAPPPTITFGLDVGYSELLRRRSDRGTTDRYEDQEESREHYTSYVRMFKDPDPSLFGTFYYVNADLPHHHVLDTMMRHLLRDASWLRWNAQIGTAPHLL